MYVRIFIIYLEKPLDISGNMCYTIFTRMCQEVIYMSLRVIQVIVMTFACFYNFFQSMEEKSRKRAIQSAFVSGCCFMTLVIYLVSIVGRYF